MAALPILQKIATSGAKPVTKFDHLHGSAHVVCAFSLLCFALCAAKAHATTIVEIRTSDEVVLAADSAGTFSGGDKPTQVQAVCKIYQTGRFFFGVGGLVADPYTDFNVPKIVAQEFRDDRSADDALKAVEIQLQNKLPAELTQLEKHGWKPPRPDSTSIAILVASIENGVPVALVGNVRPSPLPRTLPDVQHEVCPSGGNMCINGNSVWWAGLGDIISRRIDLLKTVGSTPSARLARSLVQLEIDTGDPGVGGPIDVVRILPSGPVFDQMKPDCPTVIRP